MYIILFHPNQFAILFTVNTLCWTTRSFHKELFLSSFYRETRTNHGLCFSSRETGADASLYHITRAIGDSSVFSSFNLASSTEFMAKQTVARRCLCLCAPHVFVLKSEIDNGHSCSLLCTERRLHVGKNQLEGAKSIHFDIVIWKLMI